MTDAPTTAAGGTGFSDGAAELLARSRQLLAHAQQVYQHTPHATRLAELARRLDEPLRVAIAGRVKAGKSTLLNALISDRLAPTDAGECTRIVTWYQDGHTYRVTALPVGGGEERQLKFQRLDHQLQVDLGDLTPETTERLTVTWPSRALRTATLIDTPGIGSLSENVARRTFDLLAAEDEETPADAVIYLLRHVHRDDIEFLHAFHDTEVAQPNPINAIGVLSRADEIGAGRLDSLASARRIARRMTADPSLRRVVQTVVPVAGLLAETAATLTEAEAAQLRVVAALSPREAHQLLLTADRFLTLEIAPTLSTEQRRHLLDRFGLYGLRLATNLLRHQPSITTSELANHLVDRSGITELRRQLDSLFYRRRDTLKARSTLLALDQLIRHHPVPGTDGLANDLEQTLANAHPFQELRILTAIRSGWITGKEEVLNELEHIIGGYGSTVHQRLQLPDDADEQQLMAVAQEHLARWQRRAENPLTNHHLATAARVAIRTLEGILTRRTS